MFNKYVSLPEGISILICFPDVKQPMLQALHLGRTGDSSFERCLNKPVLGKPSAITGHWNNYETTKDHWQINANR